MEAFSENVCTLISGGHEAHKHDPKQPFHEQSEYPSQGVSYADGEQDC